MRNATASRYAGLPYQISIVASSRSASMKLGNERGKTASGARRGIYVALSRGGRDGLHAASDSVSRDISAQRGNSFLLGLSAFNLEPATDCQLADFDPFKQPRFPRFLCVSPFKLSFVCFVKPTEHGPDGGSTVRETFFDDIGAIFVYLTNRD